MFLESKLLRFLNFMPDIYFHGSRKNRNVALTFDDGPTEQTGELLEILDKYDAKGTFFVLGRKAKFDRGLVKAIDIQGSEIGNHSYSHKNLLSQSRRIIGDELLSTEEILHELDIFPDIFRPPYGNLNPKVVATARVVGYRTIMSDVDPRDWKKKRNSKNITSYITSHTRKGSIINLHEGIFGDGYNHQTTSVLKDTIQRLKDEGYSFDTVSSLLYQSEKK